ncbi:hypothetical protein OESDEN_01092 [Oesophagostomum dentatum]|uniref:Cytochrome b561 domain-containing protein n=1 Tax=Oesophagostomum dentatum TaxID=61180 RepID=A0A0B1TSV2_OESDE|nr:hypothetical protein OESDEN_01092 [Oesophagostomum dentatum]
MAVLIAIMQPLIALMRCQPDTGARPIFNWTHRIMGITGIFFALIAILIAANSFEGLWSDASWAFGIAIFYVVIAILTVVVLELLSYLASKAPNKTSSMEMRNRAQHRFDDSGNVISSPPKTVNKRPMYGTAAVYFIFVLFSLCIAALLIVMLSV